MAPSSDFKPWVLPEPATAAAWEAVKYSSSAKSLSKSAQETIKKDVNTIVKNLLNLEIVLFVKIMIISKFLQKKGAYM